MRGRTRRVRERRPDGRAIPDAIDEGERRGPLRRRSRDRARYPRIDGPVLGEDEIHEEEREVARAEAVGGHEDDEAHRRDEDGVHEEPGPVAQGIARVAVGVGIEDHEDVGRGNEEQGNGLAVPQRLRERREEILESRGAGDAHVGDGEEVGLDV